MSLNEALLSESTLATHHDRFDRALHTPPRHTPNPADTPSRKNKTTDERINLRVSFVGYKPDLQSIYNPTKSQQDLQGMLNHAIQSAKVEGDEARSPPYPKTPLLHTLKESVLNFDLNLSEGSSLGSIFNLCSATLGAGALSLPFAFSQCGLVAGVLFLLLAGMTTHLSIKLLVEASDKTQFNSYELLTVQLYGKGMGIAVELSILIFCFGTCIAYIVAVGDILEQGVLDVFDLPDYITRERLMVLFWAVVMFPLSMLEKINSLRFASMFGVCSIFFLSFSTATHSIESVVTNGWSEAWGLDDVRMLPKSPMAFIKSMPVIMFAFSCQVNVFSIYEELNKKSARRMNRISNNAIRVCVFAYLLMGVFGYLNFGDDTQGNILKNYCVQNKDEPLRPLMIAAFVCIVITVIMAYPLNIFPSRYTIEVILARWAKRRERRLSKDSIDVNEIEAPPVSLKESSRLLSDDDFDFEDKKPLGSRSRHFLITLLISGSSLLIALVVPNINTVFGLMGATCSAFVCFVLPGAFAISLNLYEGKPGMKVAVYCLVYGGTLIGMISTAVTLWGIVYPEETESYCDSR